MGKETSRVMSVSSRCPNDACMTPNARSRSRERSLRVSGEKHSSRITKDIRARYQNCPPDLYC